MRAVGMDAGSTTFKAVVLERGPGGSLELVASRVEPALPLLEQQVQRALEQLSVEVGEPLEPIAATGYGRKRVPGARRVLTEITCHARGAYHQIRSGALLLELGGQDSKVILLGPGGEVEEFRMNDRCSAGTGRFLEVMLQRLGVSVDQVGPMVRQAPETAAISSTCTVFAETEVISLLARGVAVDVVLRGLHAAFAQRIHALIGEIPAHLPLWLAGGVARNEGMVQMLAERLERPPLVLEHPQLNGAIGAALSLL